MFAVPEGSGKPGQTGLIGVGRVAEAVTTGVETAVSARPSVTRNAAYRMRTLDGVKVCG